MTLSLESLCASLKVTFEWFFPCVYTDVRNEVALFVKFFTTKTVRANERPFSSLNGDGLFYMRTFMCFEHAQPRITFYAAFETALECSFFFMNVIVGDEIRRGYKTFVAALVIALVWFCIRLKILKLILHVS